MDSGKLAAGVLVAAVSIVLLAASVAAAGTQPIAVAQPTDVAPISNEPSEAPNQGEATPANVTFLPIGGADRVEERLGGGKVEAADRDGSSDTRAGSAGSSSSTGRRGPRARGARGW